MADATSTSLQPVSPLARWRDRFSTLAPAILLAESPVAQVVVRTTDATVIAQLDLPAACQVRRADDEVAIWLGPDEWLLCRPGVTGHDYLAEIASKPTDTSGVYLMDATGQRTRLLLGGRFATTILAHGCAIDLHPESFGPDEAAQTLLAQAGIILHRNCTGDEETDPQFAVFVRTSFADYLAHWLVDASVEYVTSPESARS
ncbi:MULTISPECIES: sarcosine oxidase subunit gamma [unclassified Gordonia (in: high G+C Gram-positive bacteria)]